MRPLSLLALVLLAAPASAQFGAPAEPCPRGEATAYLRGADVRATLYNNGALFHGAEHTYGNGYITPLSAEDDGPSPMYLSALWVGGEVQGEVRTAASGYTRYDYRPGRTGEDGVPPDAEACAAADHIWVVSREDVTLYYDGAPPTDDLASWPVHLGAPVLDGDGIPGNYDLEAGDQPAIRGDVTAFWAMTDTASERFDDELPLGIDATAEAFAFNSYQLGQQTFYRFTVTNRNAVPIENAYLGMFDEADLGDASDDYGGTDTTAHLAYTYNGRDDDAVYGVPPAIGFAVLESPSGFPNGRDDDGDGETDEADEPLGLSTRMVLENVAPGPTSDPARPEGYYAHLRGRWRDGSPLYAYGYGYNHPQAPVTTFAFPGDPTTDSFWSEENVDGMGTNGGAGQRRGSFSTGPLRLLPRESATLMVGLLFAQGEDRLHSVSKLRAFARGIRQAAAADRFAPVRVEGSIVPPGPPDLAVRRPYPNPFRETTAVEVRGATPEAALTVTLYDVLGRTVQGPFRMEGDAPAPLTVGAGLAPGVYLVRIAGLGFDETFPIAKVE